MTRQEFLAKLRQALESELDHRTVQENVDYYNSYIIEETAKGRPESDVIAELGDPWVIARSVIGMSGDGLGAQTAYETASGRGQENKSREKSGGYQGRGEEADFPLSEPGGKDCFLFWGLSAYFCW